MGSMDDPAVREGADPLLLDSNSRSYAVTRTINFRILPIFLAMASLCYIDRTNTAFASLQMNRDLKFSAEAYGEKQQWLQQHLQKAGSRWGV